MNPSRQYKLLKDLPTITKGTIFHPMKEGSSLYSPINGGSWFDWIPEEIVHGCPDWFQLIEQREWDFCNACKNKHYCSFSGKCQQQEVQEDNKPEWEILLMSDATHNKFERTKNGMFTQRSGGWGEYSYDFIIKNGGRILQVKRLSDGELFTVGDEIQHGKITGFSILGFTRMHINSLPENVTELKNAKKILPSESEQETQDSFVWDDYKVLDLLSEYARTYIPKNEKSWVDAIIKFKSKLQSHIPKDPELKEKVLGRRVGIIDTSTDPPTQYYTQTQLEEAERLSFEAGRKTHYPYPTTFSYETFNDYLKAKKP